MKQLNLVLYIHQVVINMTRKIVIIRTQIHRLEQYADGLHVCTVFISMAKSHIVGTIQSLWSQRFE